MDCPSHRGRQGFKSPRLHPNLAGQSVASVEPATLTACSGRAAAAGSSHSPAGRASRDQRDSVRGLPMTTQRGHRQLPRRRSSRASSLSRSATQSTWPTANHLPRRRPTDPPLAQRGLWQLRARGSNLGQTTRRRGHGGRPRRPRPSQPCGCRPHRHAPRPHSRRTQRTPERADTGHLDAQMPAPDTGHRLLGQAPWDTGHSQRTPTRTGRRQHSRRPDSWASSPSDRMLGRPTVFLLSHYQAAAGSLRWPGRASAPCSPRTIAGRA
jgi:hypothetical protein